MKKIYLLFFIMLFGVMTGCLPKTQAKIAKALLAAEKDEELIKVDDVDGEFDNDIEAIVFAGEIEGSGTNKVKVVWNKEDAKKSLKEQEKKLEGDDDFKFELAEPATGWDIDDYVINIYVNDEQVGEKEFSITGEEEKKLVYDKKSQKSDTTKSNQDARTDIESSVQAQKQSKPKDQKNSYLVPKSNPAQIAGNQQGITTPNKADKTQFINGFMCNGLYDDGSCQGIVDYYYDNARYFYANTDWTNLKSGDDIWAVWYWEGFSGQGEYLGDSGVDILEDTSGYINFSLYNNDYWYSGSYWVEIYYNDTYFTTIPFAVYSSDFEPGYKYPDSGYYNEWGEYILYDGSGYYDVYGNFWTWDTDWGIYDWYDYPESGYYDEWGNYILDDGSGYYDQYGYFWYWEELWGDGWYDEFGNYYLADGTGYIDEWGNYWPTETYSPIDGEDGYYDDYGNYILYDGSGYYDIYGDFYFWDDWYYDDWYYEDGYYDYDGNYVLYDGTGYYDWDGNFHYWDEYVYDDYDYYYEDGYYDSYGNYILYDGTGYYDSYGTFYYYDDYYYDDYYYDDYYWDHPNGDIEYWDDYYYDDYYYDDYYWDY